MKDALDYFSPDYAAARERFRASARVSGATPHTLELAARGPSGEALTIDIAWLGAQQPRRVLLHSSGLHGVEGFAGSAIQLALLARPPALAPDCALVLVHALNPYGMAWLRRANEHNVDLNRNFPGEGNGWAGAPALYRRVNRLLNPPTPPGLDFFALRTLSRVVLHGFRPLKQAVAEGQYEFERGLFYGGKRPERGPLLFLDWISGHFRSTTQLLAVDVHTGLGRSGEETVIAGSASNATPAAKLGDGLGREIVAPTQDSEVAYTIRGGLGDALRQALPETAVDAVVQEIGTRSPFTVLRALRDENRWHHYGDGHLEHPTKRRLRETLCPSAPHWRDQALARGIALVARAAQWLSGQHDR